ncbi:MAG: prolipoprotein diacylglyceryl transferase [Phycisphaerales bacterium]
MTLFADAYLHSLDKVLLPIWGNVAIRWYGLAYLAGFIAAWLLLRWMSRSGRVRIPFARTGDFLMFVVVGVLVGGRLGYVAFYDQSLLWPLTDIIAVWDGGMSFHGGAIGVILAVCIFAHINKLSKLHLLDFAAFACCIGLFCGRVANFVNGELWGKELPAHLQAESPWWSLKYPAELAHMAVDPSHKAELANALAIPRAMNINTTDWAITVRDYGRSEQANRLFDGWIQDIVIELRHGNQPLADALQPLLPAYYPSQLIQAFAEGPLLMMVLAIVWLQPRKPGVVGGTFLITYGILRIATEVYRQPDEGVAIILGLQRGQLLSVLMILSGVIGLIIVVRRDVEPMGGFLRSSGQPEGARS